jgi:hypothetical protein
MSEQEETPKIQIDSDWKAEAQAEKDKLSAQADASPGDGAAAGAAGARGMPPASFETLLSTLATQALFAMGAIPDPATGQRMQHLDLARHHIDMLAVLEEKTKGNLSEDEAKVIASTVYELRSRYIQLSTAARQV